MRHRKITGHRVVDKKGNLLDAFILHESGQHYVPVVHQRLPKGAKVEQVFEVDVETGIQPDEEMRTLIHVLIRALAVFAHQGVDIKHLEGLKESVPEFRYVPLK